MYFKVKHEKVVFSLMFESMKLLSESLATKQVERTFVQSFDGLLSRDYDSGRTTALSKQENIQ